MRPGMTNTEQLRPHLDDLREVLQLAFALLGDSSGVDTLLDALRASWSMSLA
jgi:hypothetical protein